MLDRLQDEVSQLIKLSSNLKKSINTIYKRETLELKINFAEDFYSGIEATLSICEEEIPLRKFNFFHKGE